jgi:hypothetical protein
MVRWKTRYLGQAGGAEEGGQQALKERGLWPLLPQVPTLELSANNEAFWQTISRSIEQPDVEANSTSGINSSWPPKRWHVAERTMPGNLFTGEMHKWLRAWTTHILYSEQMLWPGIKLL